MKKSDWYSVVFFAIFAAGIVGVLIATAPDAFK
jgi:hypothetical protein